MKSTFVGEMKTLAWFEELAIRTEESATLLVAASIKFVDDFPPHEDGPITMLVCDCCWVFFCRKRRRHRETWTAAGWSFVSGGEAVLLALPPPPLDSESEPIEAPVSNVTTLLVLFEPDGIVVVVVGDDFMPPTDELVRSSIIIAASIVPLSLLVLFGWWLWCWSSSSSLNVLLLDSTWLLLLVLVVSLKKFKF